MIGLEKENNMPYISKSQREVVDADIDRLVQTMKSVPDFSNNKAGILNYIISRICCEVIGNNKEDIKYAKVNEVIGSLECTKLELYRRLAGPYEDLKIIQNGDLQLYEKVQEK